MLFNSISFLIFFPIVVLFYYLIPKKFRYIWLLIASYYFYMSWNPRYVVLLLLSTIVTYLSGLFIPKAKTISLKRLVVALSFTINLCMLGLFKYFDFFMASLNRILNAFHITAVSNPFSFVLPVGISFYVFQALSYTMDVYRGEMEPEKNPVRYALFVSFFPLLGAGPIERSKNLLGQIKEMDEKSKFDIDNFRSGLILMAYGLFQKMVIADRVAIFTDEIFGNYFACGTVETLFGAFAFALQIYCDFGGYSLIAIGAARVMGFTLMENFNAPYLAGSIAEFWRRWHISLSTWFRDYLYIPLGGNRKGRLRKYLNLMITFLVSGLWHGANWSFVIWGGLHGVYQVVGDLLKPVKLKLTDALRLDREAFSFKFGQVIFTFLLTSFAWIFFKAESVTQAFGYIGRLFTKWNPWVLFDESLYNFGLDRYESGILIAAVFVLVIFDLLKAFKKINLDEFILRQNCIFRWIAITALVLSVIVYGKYGIDFDSSQFIYFAF